ncbi:MAG: dipeptidyl aminopeptidase [Verrucomicrobia bacterium]|nr:dipeptidyl aminopeptidase [Verrucomicrobiota bacterium]
MLKKLTVLWLAAVVVAGASDQPPAPARHAITHEDVWLMRRLSTPTPSPDGKWVVYTVTEPAYDAKEQWADLWIKSLTDDSPPRRLTFSKGGEGSPDWSPDGTKLAFSAKREGDEAGQIYVLDLSGGEAERVTNLTLGAGTPKWSPDGKSLLYVSQAYPGAADEEANKTIAKERKERKYNVRAYEQFPPRYWNYWLDEKKPHLFVQEAKAGAKPKDLFAGTKLAGLAGFGGVNGDSGQNLEFEWTPDGLGAVFIAALNRDEAARTPTAAQIFLSDAAGGEPRRLTQDTASYAAPKFSPDGKTLLCVFDPNTPDKIYDLPRLASFPWPFRNERRVLTANLDRGVGNFATPSGSDRIYFTFEHAGLEQLHSVGYAGGDVRDETSPATGTCSNLQAGGAALVGMWESAVDPQEI